MARTPSFTTARCLPAPTANIQACGGLIIASKRLTFLKNGNLLLSADYSQIELRVIAALSSDYNMINAFNEKKDIHSSTAAKIFNIPIDEVTREQRTNAKTVNFGIIYDRFFCSIG